MCKTNVEKTGLIKLGFVNNLTNCCSELNDLLPEGYKVSLAEINNAAKSENVVYLNRQGFPKDQNGTVITKENAAYLYFEVGHNNKNGIPIIGWFEINPKNKLFYGVNWGTKASLDKRIRISRLFHMGEICFDHKEDGLSFLDDLAINTIPEAWSFKNRTSTINHPILKSYIENIFERLTREYENGNQKKIVKSKDGKHIIFNSNLLDKYFHEIYIAVDVRKLPGGEFLLVNPQRIRKTSTLIQLGFDKDVAPEQPRFFKNVEEVIFQPSWMIDKDYDKFEHIIEDRRMRFPAECQNESSDSLARKLDDAITFAVAIAQINYKFIVPMYRPQTDSIQLLMPIYLKGSYSAKPDFALILTPDKDNELYTPETILPLDAVYQNARLIAKPDDTWLNPDTIL